MERTPGHAWSELVSGAFVEDATGLPWKLLEEHPHQRGKFLGVAPNGDTAVLEDPGKPVTAWVPSPEEAMSHLRDILGARVDEDNGFTMENLNIHDVKPNRQALRTHLITMHGEYIETTAKMPELIACHNHAHAIGRFNIAHSHGRTS